MQKSFRSLLMVVAALLIALPAHGEVLKITGSSWAPYVDTESVHNGFAMALVSAALTRAGYEAEVTIAPWPGALDATVAGTYDVIAAIWYREDRAETLAFSEPFIDCEIALIKLASTDFRFEGLDSLVGLKIGVVDDYAYSRQAIDRSGFDILSSTSVAESVAKLRTGEIDIVVADRRVALFHINERAHAKSFDVLPDALLKRGLRIAVPRTRPDHEEIVAAFDAAISEMQADGSYNDILATFRISTW